MSKQNIYDNDAFFENFLSSRNNEVRVFSGCSRHRSVHLSGLNS